MQILSRDFKIKNENDKMILEVVRLLKAKDLSAYLNNDNKFLKEVAIVVEYARKDIDARFREIARMKAEQTWKNREAWAKAYWEEEGKKEQLIENIKNLHEAGFSNEDIAKGLKIDISCVEKFLKK